jgi:hypothetical protein
MTVRTRPHQGGDLFDIFPDLPWYRRRSAVDQVEKVRRQARLTHVRASENIKRQREATRRVRARLPARGWNVSGA